MVQRTLPPLAPLHEADETAWLERSAELLRARRFDDLDPDTLAEYLTDMAIRDRREVYSRLVVLLTHLLKWEHQPTHRGGSWLATILEQQRELRQLMEAGTLRNHAAVVLADAYVDARKEAAAQTGLPRTTFPETNGWGIEEVMAEFEAGGVE